jgi:DNA-directed RNA polymerase subunit alpha
LDASTHSSFLVFFRRDSSWRDGNLVYFGTISTAARSSSNRRELFSQLNFFEGREPTMTRIPLNRAYEHSQDLKEKLEMSTAEIGLAVRTTNCLEERGVFTVDDLLHCTREDLLSISNFGEKTLEEVYKALENVGFYRPGRQPAGV